MAVKHSALPSLAAAALAMLCPAAWAAPLSGSWLTEDGSSKIRFEPCDQRVCGRIVWLKDTIDPDTGRDWRDKNNPDEAQRGVKLLGLAIFKNLTDTGEAWTGDVYNPEDGRTYSVKIRTVEDGKLEVTGCVLAGLLCQSEVWTIAAD